MLAILLISGAYLYRLSQRPLFDHTMLREIRETWNGDELFTSLRDGQGIDKQLLRLTESSKFLSPDYLPFLPSVASLGVEIKRVRRRYIQALSEFPEHERARALASAFLERPGETLLSGIALVSAARTYASHLAVKDFLHSQEIFDFAMEQELMVAGCFRAVDDEEAFHRLMDSQMALEALSKCISCSCFEIVAVPQIQIEEFAIENSSEDMQKAKFQESVYDKLDTMNKELKEMDQRHRQALDDIKNLLGQAVSRVSI
ncbi:hypothetical protein AB1Y20_006126 [Prymnesium parvum]|uniref:Uncharacterized protein n=1 Tax=Prymnesium parvum TaxID=97485 RepID=A0AB34J2C9_PRYPA